jgi:hypothetical protein
MRSAVSRLGLCLAPVSIELMHAWDTPPTLPADLAAQCPPIPDFKSDSFDDLALAFIDLTSQYAECSARHDAVVQAWPK